jgi:CRISPR-associated protein Cas5t
VQPHWRDFLFKPQLTLYLNNPSLGAAFRSPMFCVILGRSQDLAEIVSVDEIELEEQAGAYFVNTLLPFSYRPSVGFGVTVLMPRFIEPPPGRRAHSTRGSHALGGTGCDLLGTAHDELRQRATGKIGCMLE